MDKIKVTILSCLLCAVGIFIWLIAGAADHAITEREKYVAACEASGGKAVWNGRFRECLLPR
jgi:hypothetical protein